jgi:hypothetical protein
VDFAVVGVGARLLEGFGLELAFVEGSGVEAAVVGRGRVGAESMFCQITLPPASTLTGSGL